MAVDMTKPNWNANMTTYVSQVFQTDWDSAPVSMAYTVYIRDNYVHDLNPSADLSPRCSAQSPAMQKMQHQTAMISNKRIGHAIGVDFSDSSAQAAAGNVVGTQAATATQAAAAQAASAKFYISCSTSGGAGIDTYYTGVFPIKNATTTPRGVLASPESQVVLDHFYAYLTQKGYNFKPGSSSACDIARTEAAAQAAQHKRAYEGGGCSTCGKVVETGWKDDSHPDSLWSKIGQVRMRTKSGSCLRGPWASMQSGFSISGKSPSHSLTRFRRITGRPHAKLSESHTPPPSRANLVARNR